MFRASTNVLIFTVYFFIMVLEFVLLKIVDISYSTPWLITTLAYIMVIAFQVLAKANEYLEKSKVRGILSSILDTISGIPLINKDGKIIIKWDIIFKKLIDKKEYALYDNIIKIKTKTIDHYVNQYPSLLFDSSMDMIERNSRIDTNSIISGRKESLKEEKKELDLSEEIKNKLYIKYLASNKITIGNYDSSINIDVVLNNEYEPPEYEKLGIIPDDRYDGFSVMAFYKDEKHIIVPRTMVFNKRIDKEKWLYRNIERIMKCADSISKGTFEYAMVVDEYSLKDVLSNYVKEDSEKILAFRFECIDDNLLVFKGSENGKDYATAYCTLETSHNGFEIKLEKYELKCDDKTEIVDEEKTIAIGNAYQPLVTIMEKMPVISNNIKLALTKKDIEELVIR